MDTSDDLCFRIALSLVPGVGFVTAKNLLAWFGSARAIFKAKEQTLMKVPGVGSVLAGNIVHQQVLSRAEAEVGFIRRHRIRTFFYQDEDYPSRLRQCEDAPLILFAKGEVNPFSGKMVAIVGTRKATEHGRRFCDELVEGMARHGDYCVISGLAYGIDVAAHKACLKHGVKTIGVLGHGLDQIYPSLHRPVAEKMLKNGCLVTDFISHTDIERQNFLQRNRIIAGLADAVVIVESAARGGALVTADIAGSYNRDVFAVPGRTSDLYSKGCNELIKRNKASLIENLDDLEYFMSWQPEVDHVPAVQPRLFTELAPDEQSIVNALGEKALSIDEICQSSMMPAGLVSSLLLGLEFQGVVISLPGKVYKLRF
ncbi:MAG: DNA-processing protein DprA [Mangrovibacterium sp.]|nr:DNA-processing protein DprA [Mangrovibacterium sp.]